MRDNPGRNTPRPRRAEYVAACPPVPPARRPTALPSLDAPCVTVLADPRAAFNPLIAEGDTSFCSVGFRLFLVSALMDMDQAMRQGVMYRTGLRHAAAQAATERRTRRSERNQYAAARAAAVLTPSTAPRIAQTMFARALHASDDDAPTGLLPAVTA